MLCFIFAVFSLLEDSRSVLISRPKCPNSDKHRNQTLGCEYYYVVLAFWGACDSQREASERFRWRAAGKFTQEEFMRKTWLTTAALALAAVLFIGGCSGQP